MKRVLFLFALVVLTGVIITPGLSVGYVGDFSSSVVLTSDSPFVYKDERGYTVIVGEVENTNSKYSVKDVRINANFYDDVSSKPLEIVEGGTVLSVIPPLGKSPYMIKSNSPNHSITQASVSMNGLNGADPKLKQISIELSDIVVDSNLHFSGIIKNTLAPMNNANVYLAFYDDSETPVETLTNLNGVITKGEGVVHNSKIIGVSAIPIGNVKLNEMKKFSFNEKIPKGSVSFLLFSESDKSYSVPKIFYLGSFAHTNFVKPSYRITYDTFGRQFFDTPLVCAYKHNWGDGMNKSEKMERIKSDQSAGLAVQDWQSALQENEKNELKDNWKIDYKIITPMDRLHNLQKDCNVIIEFKERSERGDNVLGITYVNYNNTGVSLIDIFYDNFGHVWTPEELRPTVTHELGHAIGLGHYVADDPMINKEWEEGTREPESIMTTYSYDNLGIMKIKPIDIEKVKSMYTPNGFKSVSVSQTKIPSEKVVSDAKKLADKKLADKKLADKKLADKKLADKKLADKKLADKKLADKKLADKKLADKKLADKKLADKKLADKKLADKKLADKKLDDTKKTKMAEEKAKK